MSSLTHEAAALRAATLVAVPGSLLDGSLDRLRSKAVLDRALRDGQVWAARINELLSWAVGGDEAGFQSRLPLTWNAFDVLMTPAAATVQDPDIELLEELICMHARTVSPTSPRNWSAELPLACALLYVINSGKSLAGQPDAHVALESCGDVLYMSMRTFAEAKNLTSSERESLAQGIEELTLAYLSGDPTSSAVAGIAEASPSEKVLRKIVDDFSHNSVALINTFRNPASSDSVLADAIRATLTADPAPSRHQAVFLGSALSSPKAGEAVNAALLETLDCVPQDTLDVVAQRLLSSPLAPQAWAKLISRAHRDPSAHTYVFLCAAASSELPIEARISALSQVKFDRAARGWPANALSESGFLSQDTPAVLVTMLLGLLAETDLDERVGNMYGSLVNEFMKLVAHPGLPAASLKVISRGRNPISATARAQLKIAAGADGEGNAPTRLVKVSNIHETTRGLLSGAISGPSVLDVIVQHLCSPGNSHTRRIFADMWVDLVNSDPSVVVDTPPAAYAALKRFKHPFEFTPEAILALYAHPEGAALAGQQIAKALN